MKDLNGVDVIDTELYHYGISDGKDFIRRAFDKDERAHFIMTRCTDKDSYARGIIDAAKTWLNKNKRS